MIIDDKILKQTPLAEGGEGVIHEYNNQIIKIYKSNVNKYEKLEKLKRLMNKNLPNYIVKPLDIVYDSRKQFLGYSMNKVEGEEFRRLSNKKFLRINNISTKDIIKLLVDIKNTLGILHKQNIYIGDLNDCNILFNKNLNLFFIDVDSWTIDEFKCPVCMDSFKDPLLVENNFSNSTDEYAFSILAFKTLTKLHPFGGTMNPDIGIIERMERGISVIDNDNVVIPKTIKKWSYISPKLIEEMKEIFNTSKRFLLDKSLEDFSNHLKYCDKHKEFYYGKFSECPLCNEDAKIVTAPIKISGTKGIPYIKMIFGSNIKTILSKDSYLDINNYVVHNNSNSKICYEFGNRYYFSDNGSIIYTVRDKKISLQVKGSSYDFDKIYKSSVIIKDNKMYYTNLNSSLIEVTISDKGNYYKHITKVASNNIFEVYDDENYFICNLYYGMKIINISGYNYTLNNDDKIINYGIHFDSASKKWLFITENDKNEFVTYIFDKNKVIYQEDNIKYTSSLINMCFRNEIIFKAGDAVIIGFDYKNNRYKDFACEIVNETSCLVRENNKFIVINDTEVYLVG